MRKFYFVGYLGKRVEDEHLEDIKYDEDVILITNNIQEDRFRFDRIKRCFYSAHKWNKICDKEPIIANYWNKYYSLYNIEFSESDDNYVVFWDSAICLYYSQSFFKALKKRNKHLKIVFYIYDQMNQYFSERILRMTKYADAVFCTIKSECEKYGFEYFPLVFPQRTYDKNSYTIKNDIYFMGNNSDREKKLHDIYQYLKSRDVKCDFNLVGVLEKDKKFSEINYNISFSPRENMRHVLESNCVLEIMHDGMNATTARYPEVLSLNRKLLTNNINVTREPYYNSRFIRVFDKLSDIDVEWIKKIEEVDYGYKGEFSARTFINRIVEELG